MSLVPIYIGSYPDGGLNQYSKPYLQNDKAFTELENAYVWRNRVKKREGLKLVGRLRRVLTLTAMGNISAAGAGTFTFNIFTGLGLLVTEPDAQIELGNITAISIAIGAPINQTLTDSAGTGVLTVVGAGPITSASINYATGVLSITFSGAAGASAATFSGAYYPGLPVMGIDNREQAGTNDEQTIYFDTKYAYILSAGLFQEFIAGTTWSGTDADFFWCANYRGSTPQSRLFFTTNFVVNASNPIRYTDGATWTNFAPLVSAADTLYQARILIPYYGRLLALNVYEGTTAGGYGGAVNIFNRCRFSQIGNPVAVDAWRSDLFGKGGFIDAPTSEAIISAIFFKNTLIVGFERSTWQLRYVGEYGLPFIWERISSDFGTESTFSSLLFDDGVLSVGNRAIISATAVNVQRIDLAIPDIVFDEFQNNEEGLERVQGIRDYQRELAFWCYHDADTEGKFPNRSLLFNYRNNTFAIFRNNVTVFGTYQRSDAITWDSTTVDWDDMEVDWSNGDNQTLYPIIVCGNQQGYIHEYGYTSFDNPSLSITDIDMSVSPNVLTIKNHNLEQGDASASIQDGDIIYITGALYDTLGTAPTNNLNGQLFSIQNIYPYDADNVALFTWNFSTQQYEATPVQAGPPTYIGGGEVTILPQLYAQTKDFNPYQDRGHGLKMSYIDFLTDATPYAAFSVQLFINGGNSVLGNLLIGNKESETSLNDFGTITAATQANPCQITSPSHQLSTGARITISNVVGMTQVNGGPYTITVVDQNNFTLDGTNSIGFSAYITGGVWQNTVCVYYTPGSEYAWHRFYATLSGQYIRIAMTYDQDLMNSLSTHQQDWILNSMALWVRPGGRFPNAR